MYPSSSFNFIADIFLTFHEECLCQIHYSVPFIKYFNINADVFRTPFINKSELYHVPFMKSYQRLQDIAGRTLLGLDLPDDLDP